MAKAKLLPGLSADTALKDAATAILLTRSDEVTEHLRSFVETEGATALHASRTAVRRLRTALATLGEPLREADRDEAGSRLRKLFKRLGRGRDLDVKLELIGRLAPKLRGDLRQERARRYQKARRGAKKFMRDGVLRTLRAAVTDSLVLRAEGLPPSFAARSLQEGADALLTPLTDDLLKRIKAARASQDAETMHTLRLSVKRMRDTLEMLQGALPELGGWQKRLAALAGVLGELHDLDVLIEELSARLLSETRKKRRAELEAVLRRAQTLSGRLTSEAQARLSKQALQRIELDLRNARAGSFFSDPSSERAPLH